jgi:hypothetical protein
MRKANVINAVAVEAVADAQQFTHGCLECGAAASNYCCDCRQRLSLFVKATRLLNVIRFHL